MRYRITHRTDYVYQESIAFCYNDACLLPVSTAFQQCSDQYLTITPEPDFCAQRLDYFGNVRTFFSIEQPHQYLTVTANSTMNISPRPNIDLQQSPPWENVRNQLQQPYNADLIAAREFCLDSPMIQRSHELYQYVLPSFTSQRPILDAAAELMQRIYSDFVYDPNFSTIATPLQQVLLHRRGVCQDFAHVAIAMLRSIGLAARYVSGYLETLPPPGMPRLIGADASHAWFAVFVPNSGWIEFDPTNNQQPQQQHTCLAFGRDFSDVTPLKGVLFGGGNHELTVSVDVAPLEGA